MRIFEGFQKGVNLGGWLSQCSEYTKEHYDTFITEEDIKYIASLGFDHVRVPVDYNVLEDEEGVIKPEGFEYLENCRKWCETYKLNMLIDLHECYGYSFDPLKKDMDRRKFFYDTDLQERFLKLWMEIAKRFGKYSNQVAFEPLNEVVHRDVVDAWNKLINKYMTVIRIIAPKTYVVIGGVCYNSVQTVPLLDLPLDKKIVLNFHCYEPMVFTHQGAYWVDYMPSDFRIGYPKTIEEYREVSRELTDDLASAIFTEGLSEIGEGFFEDLFAPAIGFAEEKDLAIYCGEYGVIDLANNVDKIRWLADIHKVFRRFDIGHALWNYKEKDFGFVDEKFADIKDKFMEIL